jgi:hypothetical protein
MENAQVTIAHFWKARYRFTSTSSPSFSNKPSNRENPENQVPSLADPEKRRKTPYCHTEKGYLEVAEE